MFVCFKDNILPLFLFLQTVYRWDPRVDQNIRDAFISVLKDRFRDIMSNMRQCSKAKAIKEKEKVPAEGYDFKILCKYPPDTVPRKKWQRMCNVSVLLIYFFS